jgi:hypothetical protein
MRSVVFYLESFMQQCFHGPAKRSACKQAAECVFPAGLTRGLRENAGVYIGLAPQISELVLCLPILQVEGLI